MKLALLPSAEEEKDDDDESLEQSPLARTHSS